MICLLIAFSLLILGCQSDTLKDLSSEKLNSIDSITISKVDVDSLNVKTTIIHAEIECDSLLKDIILSSNFNKKLLTTRFYVWLESFENNVFTFKTANKNDEGFESVSGWFELDLNKRELKDITIEPDNPILLTFDKSKLKLLNGCN